MKTNVLFNYEDVNALRYQSETLTLPNETIFNNEENKSSKKVRSGFVELELMTDLSSKSNLKIHSKYQKGLYNDQSNLIYNTEPLHELLENNSSKLEQLLVYNQKTSEKGLITVLANYTKEWFNANYGVSKFLFKDYFEVPSSVPIQENLDNKLDFYATEINWKINSNDKYILEIKSGINNRKDILENKLHYNEVNENHLFFNKQEELDRFSFYTEAKVNYNLRRLQIEPRLEVRNSLLKRDCNVNCVNGIIQ